MVLNVHRKHKAYYAKDIIMCVCARRGYGGGGRERLHTYRYTVTTRMILALRWAAMKAILMFHELWGTKSQDSVHRSQLLKRKESRSGIEPRSLSLPALPLGQTGSPDPRIWLGLIYAKNQLIIAYSLAYFHHNFAVLFFGQTVTR